MTKPDIDSGKKLQRKLIMGLCYVLLALMGFYFLTIVVLNDFYKKSVTQLNQLSRDASKASES